LHLFSLALQLLLEWRLRFAGWGLGFGRLFGVLPACCRLLLRLL
jgi:hypothetical protein